jgi:hypothetical protein
MQANQSKEERLRQHHIELLLQRHPDWGRSDLELASLPELIDMLRIPSEGGVAEGKNTKNKLFVKKLLSEQSLIEHAKLFAKNLLLDGVPITSKNRHTVVCSTIFAHNKKTVNESSHIENGKKFINILKRLDQFSQLPLKIGSSIAIINTQMQGDSVELWGFTTPKTISKIYRDPSDKSIKQFEFNNNPDDVWPRTENAEYDGQFLMYSAFFRDKKSADHALTMLMLQGSGDLDIRNHVISEGGDQYKVKSVGKDTKGDYYVSPKSGKKVYKSGVKVGDHENPKSGETTKQVPIGESYEKQMAQLVGKILLRELTGK